MTKRDPLVVLAATALTAAGALAVLTAGHEARGAQEQDPWSEAALLQRFPDPDADAAPDDLLGALACRDCHEERWALLKSSFHRKLLPPSPYAGRGCESCHGAGREHVEKGDGDGPIRHPLDETPERMVGLCLRCHLDVLAGPRLGHREWTAPRGLGAEPLACTHCHEIHVDRASPVFAADAGPYRDVAALEAAGAEAIPAGRCIDCHPGFHPQMRASGHAFLIEKDRQCGTCHGPGSLHEESGGRAQLIVAPHRQAAKHVNATCNSCHDKGDTVKRWTCAEHSKEGVSCIVCHDANAARGRTLRKPEFELCGECHLDVKASFRLPNGHRVATGRVRCSDCHDPHGNADRVRDRDVRLRACAKCHAEKAGPFLHDHGIKRSEGCIACHAPHGSANRRLLAFSRVKPLCLQCHPETSHDLRSRKYRNCIRCHVEIHGSDLDRIFER